MCPRIIHVAEPTDDHDDRYDRRDDTQREPVALSCCCHYIYFILSLQLNVAGSADKKLNLYTTKNTQHVGCVSSVHKRNLIGRSSVFVRRE